MLEEKVFRVEKLVKEWKCILKMLIFSNRHKNSVLVSSNILKEDNVLLSVFTLLSTAKKKLLSFLKFKNKVFNSHFLKIFFVHSPQSDFVEPFFLHSTKCWCGEHVIISITMRIL